jgi:hypothetical protein
MKFTKGSGSENGGVGTGMKTNTIITKTQNAGISFCIGQPKYLKRQTANSRYIMSME